jgi:creatinine amidohydrolase
MRIADMNWMQVETYLQHDNRCVLPIGTTEQHAYLSLCVDNILPERLALDAAEPLGIPVFPVLPFGLSPYFRAYPGTLNVRMQTYLSLIGDLLNSLYEQGFRRVLIVNGHGGNSPAGAFAREWQGDHPDARVKFHNWWNAPRTWAKVQAIDPDASHASWMENFPWTRLEGVEQPSDKKPMLNSPRLNVLNPAETRAYLGDGNFGGLYQRSDEEMLALWQVAVEETRALLEHDWE